jgi:hypothetical protein
VVDERHELIEGLFLAVCPRRQQTRDVYRLERIHGGIVASGARLRVPRKRLGS